MEPADLDRFGGWRGLTFEATGAFRLEKRDRWWLVTPKGNAFLSWGMNHIMPAMVTQGYNRDHWEGVLGSVDSESQTFKTGFQAQMEADLRALGMNTLGTHSPVEYYERYHIVLSGHPGSIFRAGDEQVTMLTGEVWWFDNTKEHEVINNSADDRIHLIVDIKVFK